MVFFAITLSFFFVLIIVNTHNHTYTICDRNLPILEFNSQQPKPQQPKLKSLFSFRWQSKRKSTIKCVGCVLFRSRWYSTSKMTIDHKMEKLKAVLTIFGWITYHSGFYRNCLFCPNEKPSEFVTRKTQQIDTQRKFGWGNKF